MKFAEVIQAGQFHRLPLGGTDALRQRWLLLPTIILVIPTLREKLPTTSQPCPIAYLCSFVRFGMYAGYYCILF